jgi:molecular chaperone GrpE
MWSDGVVDSEQQKAENEELIEQRQNEEALSQEAARGEEAREPTAAEEAAEAAEAAGEAVADLDEAEVTLEHLQAELAAARDAALRAAAEAQNARRRAEQDVEKARKFALERFTGDLLPVVDNLERALETTSSDVVDAKAIVEGVELTLKGLLGVLEKNNIIQVNPLGEPFDPQLHQAMSIVENGDVEPNSVLFVMQKGYTLSGRLVRPAMVTVSKAPSGS